MTNEERQANNRKIAELLGFRFELDSTGDGLTISQWHHPECKCPAKSPSDGCQCVDGCYWGDDNEPPDFYHDEAANALVLDAMPTYQIDRSAGICTAQFYRNGQWCGVSDPDRKAAVCAAFLELHGREA